MIGFWEWIVARGIEERQADMGAFHGFNGNRCKRFTAYECAIADRKLIRAWIERAPLRMRRRSWQRKTGTGAPLLSDDQETIVRTLEHMRSVLRDHAAGHHDAAWVVERLQSIVNRSQIEAALDRLDRRRVLRLVD